MERLGVVKIISISEPDEWVYLHLSNHCVIRMTATCLQDLRWRIGDNISGQKDE